MGAAAEPNSWEKTGLVAVTIFLAVVAVDVGRERHVAYFVEDGVKIGRRIEAKCALAKLGGGDNFSLKQRLRFVRRMEEEAFAGLNLAARANEGSPFVRGKLLR